MNAQSWPSKTSGMKGWMRGRPVELVVARKATVGTPSPSVSRRVPAAASSESAATRSDQVGIGDSLSRW